MDVHNFYRILISLETTTREFFFHNSDLSPLDDMCRFGSDCCGFRFGYASSLT